MFDQHPFAIIAGTGAQEVQDFVRRFEGHVTRTVAIPSATGNDRQLTEAMQRLLIAEIDAVVFQTGGGVRFLFERIRGHVDPDRVRDALSDARTIGAGRHAHEALAAREVNHQTLTIERANWRDLIVGLESAWPLANCTIALEQTVHDVELRSGLEARGARIIDLPILGVPLRRAWGAVTNAAGDEPWPTTIFVFTARQLHALADEIRARPSMNVEDTLVLGIEDWVRESAELLGFRAQWVELRTEVAGWGEQEAQEIARFLW